MKMKPIIVVIMMALVCIACDSDSGELISAANLTQKTDAENMTLISHQKSFPVSLALKSAATKRSYATDRILVRFKNQTKSSSIQKTYSRLGVAEKRRYRSVSDLRLVGLSKDATVEKTIATLKADPDVLFAEPDYELYISETTPNDTKWADLWHLHNSSSDADINAPEAWDVVTGSGDAVIAILDTGVKYSHEDLLANMWVNPNEIADNGIDDDSNGYTDDVYGIDAVDNTGDPADVEGHGTAVAGAIGAVGNNSIGITGVNWNTQMLSCRWMNSSGTGNTSNMIECMEYIYDMKVNHGVNIIATNNSYGSYNYSAAAQAAIKAHMDAGILFVTAAGNDGVDCDVTPQYPASYDLPNIISVAATNASDTTAYWTNYGKRTIHVVAPGVDIWSTRKSGTYESVSGTSIATPIVVGLAGLLYGQDDTRNFTDIRNLILAGGTPITGMSNSVITGRRIRAYDSDGTGSLSCIDQEVNKRLLPIGSPIYTARGGTIEFSQLHINCASPAGAGDVVVDGSTTVTLADDGNGNDWLAGDGVYVGNYTTSTNSDGSHDYDMEFPDGGSASVKAMDPYLYNGATTYNWRDISSIESELNWSGGHDGTRKVTPSFSLPYGNATVNDLYVSPNGVIRVESHWTETDMNPLMLPVDGIEAMVAPFWMDLVMPADTSGVFWGEIGTTPDRELVVEWRDMGIINYGCWNIDGSTWEGLGTFQVVFKENSSEIEFQYKDVDWYGGSCDNGAHATKGIQSPGEIIAYRNWNLDGNETALLFTANTGPTADAGVDRTIYINQTKGVYGTSSDPDQDTYDLGYFWEQISGPAVTLADIDTYKVLVSAPAYETTLILQVTTTDEWGIWDTDTVTVEISNCVPTAYYHQDCDGDGLYSEEIVGRCSGGFPDTTCADGENPDGNWYIDPLPGAFETDCDDEDAAVGSSYSQWYYDNDGDSYGAGTATEACTPPDGYVPLGTDCDETNTAINPGAEEIVGDGVDQDCNNYDSILCFIDSDKDGYGNDAGDTTIADDESCDTNDGESTDQTDCNDVNAGINPGAEEIANDGIDQDCNGEDLEVCDPECVNGSCESAVCVCDTGWDGDACDDCDSSHFGADCSDSVTCNTTNGVCGSGTCYGTSGNGSCDSCDTGYYGASCTACPSCDNGSCDDGLAGNGECTCDIGWAGTLCDTCDGGWTGDLCDVCADEYYGSDCTVCDACTDGTCNDGLENNGLCICNDADYQDNDNDRTCEIACTHVTACSEPYLCNDGSGLALCDCSQPIVHLGEFLDIGFSNDVYVVQNTAYVADFEAGLVILDVSDPSNPIELGRYKPDGDFASVHNIQVENEKAYVSVDFEGLLIFDVSDPSDPAYPELIGQYFSDSSVNGTYVSGDRAYIGIERTVHIVDITISGSPSKLGEIAISDYASSIYVVGSTAYIADARDSFLIVDVGDPENPVDLVSVAINGRLTDVQVAGQKAYLTKRPGGESGAELLIYDVSDPNAQDFLALLGNYTYLDNPQGLHVEGYTVFVADDDLGIVMIDTSDSGDPSLIANYDTAERSFGVFVDAGVAYIADFNGGIEIAEILTCECATGYFGADCTACPTCDHGSCDDSTSGDGGCVCESNWDGDLCDTCAEGWAGMLCDTCDTGYYGASCDTCPNCNNGTCNDGLEGEGTCTCEEEWTGEFCDVPFVYIQVTTTDDKYDNTKSVGDCSLREAITTANTGASFGGCTWVDGYPVIILAVGTYTLSISGRGEDANATGDLDILADMTIEGTGSDETIIDAAALDRVFDIDPENGTAVVTIRDLTVQNGKLVSGHDGGGIRNDGELSLENCIIANNVGYQNGGGIYTSGTLAIESSTISGNSVPSNGYGGAIHIYTESLSIVSSTISGNNAILRGGGLFISGSAIVSMTNTTLSGNNAKEGGAIYSGSNGGSLTVVSSTISDNYSSKSGTAAVKLLYSDGGIAVTFFNSIVADNTGRPADIGGTLKEASDYNLISNISKCTAFCDTANSIVDVSADLGDLTDNGGSTHTHALLSTSQAMNNGSCTDHEGAAIDTDQRGEARPYPGGGSCDMGAVEMKGDAPGEDCSGNDDCDLGICVVDTCCVLDCVNGNCATNGLACECDTGWSGDLCDTCAEGWTGTLCDACDTGYYGTSCTACPSCDHGSCNDSLTGNGECACDTGWNATLCDACDTG